MANGRCDVCNSQDVPVKKHSKGFLYCETCSLTGDAEEEAMSR